LFGGYAGAPQLPGFLSYFYHKANNAVELDRCIWNNMHDPLKFEIGERKDQCLTLNRECTNDCRKIPYNNVSVAQFGMCSEPWKCEIDDADEGLCAAFHGMSFELS
jgi:hypothetical protein